MRRCPAERCIPLLLVVLGGVGLSQGGCTFVVGEPWGSLSVAATAAFVPADARLTEDGQFKTARDYALSLEEVTAQFAALRLRLSTGESAVSFDPRAPPPGYSLCHGGHCHASDGRLVDYAEIESEISGATAPPELPIAIVDDALALTATPVPLAFLTCTDGCPLERGAIDEVSLEITSLTVRGRVFDLRTSELARLPVDGLPVLLRLEGPVSPSVPVDIPLDGTEPGAVHLEASYALPGDLFDELLFEELPVDEEGTLLLDERGREALLESLSDSAIELLVRRSTEPRQVMGY
ncbi:MAG: hypothetical protein ACO3JL_12050 [Myxococcota bacterium]